MKGLLKYLREYRRESVLGPLLKLLEATFELFVPLVVADIVDVGIKNQDDGYILSRFGILLALAIVGMAFSVTAQYFCAKAAIGLGTNLRHALFEKIQSFSFSTLDRLGSSTLITRITSDVNTIQSGVNLALRLLLRSPFIVFGSMIMAFLIDARSATVFAIVIFLLFAVVFAILLATIPMYRSTQGQLDGVLSAVRENLTGVRVIRAFCKEEDEIARFGRANGELNRRQKKVGRISGLMNPLTYVLINMAIVALIRLGGRRVADGALEQGDVIALYNYLSQILIELIKMANLIITITKAIACANRVGDVLSENGDQPLPAPKGPAGQADSGTYLEFRDVRLCYPGASESALEGISFSVGRGQTVGIIGGTGSGKSSLVHLIPRFYDISSGNLLLDGRDVRDYDPQSLRAKVGIVLQKAALFKGSVRSNLLWGDPDADDGRLWAALEAAQIADTIREKGGLEAEVTEEGRNFSGGQRQRLSIARALVRDPEILILDDSASALDYATDAALRTAIRELPGNPTVFIVSQRAASLLHADLIVVLEDGRAVGVGTHGELLESCPVYREIYYSQYPKEECGHG